MDNFKKYILCDTFSRFNEAFCSCINAFSQRRTFKLTVDRADLVAHGIADQMVVGVKHHEDLVHAELLGGWRRPGGLVVRAAMESDGLAPLVASGVDFAIGGSDGVVAVGRGSDHWTEGEAEKK